MKLLLTLIVFYGTVNTVYCACGRPNVFTDIHTFGPECRYRCNCLSNQPCNSDTGACPNGCLPGWMGPACQYRDLGAAVNIASSGQNPPGSQFPVSYAVDGNVSTCSRTGSTNSMQSYLTIDLGSKMYISGLVIVFPPSELNSFRGFTVKVGNDSFTFTQCYANKLDDEIKTVTEISCITPQVGKLIRIEMAKDNNGTLSVCEMNIYGGRLVSFNKHTEMDSTLVNSHGTYDGAYAVDGGIYRTKADSLQTTASRTCASTEVDYVTLHNRWWRVDLMHSFSIQAVSFFARQDSNFDQYVGYSVTVGADENTDIEIVRDSATYNPADYMPKSHNLTWPRDGQFLKVNRDNVIILTICELEVFAECAYGRCGWDCNETCMCSSQTAGTHKILGTCPHGCASRWTGKDGKCNIECPDNKWGSTCDRDCGNCTTLPCDFVNGTCPGPCKAGWERPFCTQACTEGTFGIDCTNKCGHCSNGTSCDRFTGECSAGCQPGFKQPYCNTTCDAGFYGQSCSIRCGNCTKNDTCNHINGTCPNGCEPGFRELTCKEVCAHMSFGFECNEECGKCKDGETCNNVNGHCLDGCGPGWETAPLCNKPCNDGKYGDNCSQECGFCLNTQTCNHVDGSCAESCQAGYTGQICKTNCKQGTYGVNCKETCGQCANVTGCDIKTGICYNNQCQSEWRGAYCKERLESTTSGPSGGNNGVIIGAVVGGVVVVAIGVVVTVIILKRRSSGAQAKYIHRSEPSQTSRTNGAFERTEAEDVVQKSKDLEKLEDEYYNIGDPGYEVPIIRFIDTVNLRTECRKAKKDSKNIYAEFQAIPYGPLKDASEATSPEYVKKNRYRDLYPYNENRVHLPEIQGDSISTYINASYIDGYDRTKKYIAAQGALNTTVNDIWRMIWSEDIAVIAMLTDCFEEGKLKCVKYWPDEGSMQYGNINADLMSTEEYTDFTIRRFHVTKDYEAGKKTVVQYHYRAWPDKDVPDTALSIVQFWRKVREHASGTKNSQLSPWLVHCSAGIGRTGTFIATDILYDQGKNEGRVDVKNCVLNLRNQRLKMVQTKEQYFLLHEILAEILDPIGTIYSNDEFSGIYPNLVSKSATNKQKLYVEYQEICTFTEEMAEAHEEGGIYFNTFSKQKRDGEKLENIRKSRESTIIPEDKDRPRLSTAVDGCNDFINAVYIPTYRYKDRMIMTQYPLTETVVDFIRMIWQYDITEVVLLENPALEDGMYWSKPKSYQVVGPFKVETLQETSLDSYVLRTLRVSMQGSKQHKEVRQYHFQKWTKGNSVPDSTSSVLQLISDVDNSRGKSFGAPVVVQCLDGAKRCGVFSILYSVLERMKLDRQVAIAETLRLARGKRIQIIESFEQYKYCHDVINEYLRSFDVYANVT